MTRFELPPPEPQSYVDMTIFHQQVGCENYVWVFDDMNDRSKVNRCIEIAGSYADNPELNFSWASLVSLTKEIARTYRK